MIDAYIAAVRSLENHAFAGISCVHGVPLVEDCNECEPVLDHDPGFGEGVI